ncbi:MAG: 50S ribosomal protein L24 [Chloroflexota bacterium]|nr:50S ribosomal protein L24 [Chloroflexota bacterium]
MKIKVGDLVEVISGDDRGLAGRVRVALPKEDRVIVEGINFVWKHQRPMPSGGRGGQVEGGIIEFEAPIHVSNVMLICPSCDQRTRVGYEFLESGEKVRVCKKCGAIVD